jgi:hypothetical protein
METWRVLGAIALGAGGLLLVLVAMAQARDSAVRPRSSDDGAAGRVARAALIGLSLLAVTVVLALTVLPQFVIWGVAAAAWLILLTLFLAS